MDEEDKGTCCDLRLNRLRGLIGSGCSHGTSPPYICVSQPKIVCGDTVFDRLIGANPLKKDTEKKCIMRIKKVNGVRNNVHFMPPSP